MPLYKQVLLTSVKSTPRELARAFEEVAKLIVQNGGVLRATENRGVKRLGYGIFDRRWGELQKHYEAKLIVNQFTASPLVLREVEQKLKNTQPVIRFETFKIRDPVDKLMNTRNSIDEQRAQALKLVNKSRDIVKHLEKQRYDAEQAQRRGGALFDELDDYEHDHEDDVDDDSDALVDENLLEAEAEKELQDKKKQEEEEEWRVPEDWEEPDGDVDPSEEEKCAEEVLAERERIFNRTIPEWKRDVFYEPVPPEYPEAEDQVTDNKNKKN